MIAGPVAGEVHPTEPIKRRKLGSRQGTSLYSAAPQTGGHRSAGVYSAYAIKSPGDQVRHSAFGQGMVLSVRPMGGDALIEVAFDKVGTKKLMLKAAGVHLTKL